MKKQKEIPMRISRGLKWENKTYKMKKFIAFSPQVQVPIAQW